eukprot:1623935-Pyramimonas_sp.AAC.1
MAGRRMRVSVKDRPDLSGFANVETCRQQTEIPIGSEVELLVTGFSTWRGTSSLTAMHIVAPDGPIFSLTAWSSSHPDELKALHTECLAGKKSAVAPFRPFGLEVHLVAVPDCRGELNRNTCFWAFCCPQNGAYYYKSLLVGSPVLHLCYRTEADRGVFLFCFPAVRAWYNPPVRWFSISSWTKHIRLSDKESKPP